MLIRSGWGESGRSLYSQARCWRNEVLQLGVRASGGTVRLNRNSLCVISVQFRLPTTGKDMSRTGEANSLRECIRSVVSTHSLCPEPDANMDQLFARTRLATQRLSIT